MYRTLSTLFIFLAIFTATPAFAYSQVGKWLYSDSKDEFSDKTNAAAATESEDGNNFLIVGCYGGSLLQIIFKPSQFIVGGAYNAGDIRYRIDKQPPETAKIRIDRSEAIFFVEPDDKKNIAYETYHQTKKDAAKLLQAMLTGSTILINVNDAQERFSLDGASTQIPKVTNQCPFLFQDLPARKK